MILFSHSWKSKIPFDIIFLNLMYFYLFMKKIFFVMYF